MMYNMHFYSDIKAYEAKMPDLENIYEDNENKGSSVAALMKGIASSKEGIKPLG